MFSKVSLSLVGLLLPLLALSSTGCPEYNPPETEVAKMFKEIRSHIAQSEDKDFAAQAGVKRLEEYIRNNPKTTEKENINRWKLALVLKHVRKSEVILDVCWEYVRLYPSDEKYSPRALMKIFLVQRHLGEYKKGVKALNRLLEKFPQYQDWKRALYFKAVDCYQMALYKESIQAAALYLKKYKGYQGDREVKMRKKVEYYRKKAKDALDWVGKVPFRIQGRDLRGDVFDLDRWKDNVILLVFWFPQAKDSQFEKVRTLHSIHKKYGGRNFRILSIATLKARTRGEAKRKMENSINREMMSWTHIYDWYYPVKKGGKNPYYIRKYNITFELTPRTVLLDPQGKVRAVDVWGKGLKYVVGELMDN